MKYFIHSKSFRYFPLIPSFFCVLIFCFNFLAFSSFYFKGSVYASVKEEQQTFSKKVKIGSISTIKTPENVNILKVSYPCDKYHDISMEIRILDEITSKKTYLTGPLFFTSTVMKSKDLAGKNYADIIFKASMNDSPGVKIINEKSDSPASIQMKYGNMDMRISSNESIMKTWQTSIFCTHENTKTETDEFTLVFPYMDSAKIGSPARKTAPRETESFLFDLQEAEFQTPQKLLIWILSGKNVLLKTEIDWPGRSVP
ncbi:MAG: hypothetical protein Q4C96_06185 [Planctomycetia bacterium]|nr:hypothetical protein [Planctomycetia bacterium]